MPDPITLPTTGRLVGQLLPEIDNIRKEQEKGRKVRVGEYEYTVSVINGEVGVTSVNFGKSFWGGGETHQQEVLRQSHRERLRQSLNEALMQEKKWSSMNEQLKNLSLEIVTDHPEVNVKTAVYGFNENRKQCSVLGDNRQITENENMLTIDELNNLLGIGYLTPLQYLLNPDIIKIGEYPKEKEQLAEGWLKFLTDKLRTDPLSFDLFGKIKAMVAFAEGRGTSSGLTDGMKKRIICHGLAKEIERLLIKNIPKLVTPEKIGRLEKYVELMLELSRTCPDSKSMLNELFNITSNDRDARDELYSAATTHYFRNTSKQGLEFFDREGILVTFIWTGPKGKGDITKGMLAGPERDGRQQEGYHEAVTFSEMRHVLRMRAEERGLNIRFIAFSDSSSSASA